MLTEYIIRLCIAFCFLTAAAVCDIKTRKIPNYITFPMILSGITIAALFSRTRLPEIAVFFVLCLLFSLLPGIGMGDIKLLIGMGAYLAPTNVFLELALASGVIVLVQLIKKPKYTWFLIGFRRMRPLRPSECQAKNKTNSVPLAPYLLVAAFVIEGATLLCR